MNEFPSLKNHLLIAMPNLMDRTFHQSVTFIVEHDENGAMGMVINQPLSVDFNELFEQLNIQTTAPINGDKKILSGGPVQVERGFILHSPTGNWESSIRLKDDIAVTTSKDILDALSIDKGPSEIEIILGYAGWDAGQLDQEILENSWLSVPATAEILFRIPVKDRWKESANLLGVDINKLSSFVGHS